MNVLITSSSSKVLLIKSFAESAHAWGDKVFTGDISENVASAFFGDKHFVLPNASNVNIFIETLERICIDYDVNLVVPTRDGEIGIMSEFKDYFYSKGVTLLVPEKKAAQICLNKRMFSDFVNSVGINAIPILKDLNVGPPYFVRPISGSAGYGAKAVNTHEEAKLFMNDDFLIHPLIDAEEFSVDLLMTLDGSRALQAVCRQRIRIIGGESKISKIVYMPVLEQTCIKIGNKLGLVGHNVLQAFYSEDLGVYMIEANARFGGASNLSIKCGLDSPNRIIKMMHNDNSALKNGNINVGATMYRYSEDLIVQGI